MRLYASRGVYRRSTFQIRPPGGIRRTQLWLCWTRRICSRPRTSGAAPPSWQALPSGSEKSGAAPVLSKEPAMSPAPRVTERDGTHERSSHQGHHDSQWERVKYISATSRLHWRPDFKSSSSTNVPPEPRPVTRAVAPRVSNSTQSRDLG
jgi:hypothetical protein